MKTFLVTGCAGFLGMSCARQLLKLGHFVYGVDTSLKISRSRLQKKRLAQLVSHDKFRFINIDLTDSDGTAKALNDLTVDYVLHFAATSANGAEPGKTSSHRDNLIMLENVLSACVTMNEQKNIQQIVVASSGTVYEGIIERVTDKHRASNELDQLRLAQDPYSEGAVKRAIENLCVQYVTTTNLNISVCRYFSVYGPWMNEHDLLSKFWQSVKDDVPLNLVDAQNTAQDYIFIDDAVDITIRLCQNYNNNMSYGHRDAGIYILNVGSGRPITNSLVVELAQQISGRTAVVRDITKLPYSYSLVADTTRLENFRKNIPKTTWSRNLMVSTPSGIRSTIKWFEEMEEVTA